MKDASYFKNKLVTLRHEIFNRSRQIDADIRHVGMTTDLDDQAIELENDEVLHALSATSEKELLMIDAAIRRVDSDEYFHCQTCGETIALARLELLPFTNLCVSCAEKRESETAYS